MRKSAVLSGCGKYRYRLERVWDDSLNKVCFVMLNPSTADASEDDPTIRRCINFAKSWGYGGIVVVNLFAIRGTNPKVIKEVADPIGALNTHHIVNAAWDCDQVIAAWGAHGSHAGQDKAVLRMLFERPVFAIKLTAAGHPGHPLYVKGDAPRIPYN